MNDKLREALLNIRELNMTATDEDGRRWAQSDLIEQEIVAALAAAPQPAPAAADERDAMIEVIVQADDAYDRVQGGTWAGAIADALLAAGWTRGGAEAELREALEPFARLADRYDPPEGDDADTCWSPNVPTFGDLRRARAAIARPSAPETVCHAQEGIGRMECHKCRKSWALDDPRLPPCREDEA